MLKPEERKRITVVAAMIGGILCLHYFTFPGMKHYHAVYQTLFYLPLVLGSFWFGFKGAIGTSLSVSIFYLPYVSAQWQGFSFEDFDKMLEGVLYVFIGFCLVTCLRKQGKNKKNW